MSWCCSFSIISVSVTGIIDGTTSLREGDIAVTAGKRSKVCFARSCLWAKSVDGHVYVAYRLSPDYSTCEQKHTAHCSPIHFWDPATSYVMIYELPVPRLNSWNRDKADKERDGTCRERHLCEICCSDSRARLHRHPAKVWVRAFVLKNITPCCKMFVWVGQIQDGELSICF